VRWLKGRSVDPGEYPMGRPRSQLVQCTPRMARVGAITSERGADTNGPLLDHSGRRWPVGNASESLGPLRPITLTDQALTRGPVASESIAVGTVLTGGPPHRPERAELPHSVLALGVERQTAALGRDGSHGVAATTCLPLR